MLIGLNDKNIERRYEVAKELQSKVGKDAIIYDTDDFQETVNIVKKYKFSGKQPIILIHPIQEIATDQSEGLWRAGEIWYARRGGLLFGEKPERETMAWRGKTPDNVDDIIDTTKFYVGKAKYVQKATPSFYGRSGQDPHTIIFGFRPSWPRLSTNGDHLIGGLPSEWWKGVGFFVPSSLEGRITQTQKILDAFPYASRVTITRNMDEVLDEMGEPHQALKLSLPGTSEAGEKYGKELRILSRLDAERVVV